MGINPLSVSCYCCCVLCSIARCSLLNRGNNAKAQKISWHWGLCFFFQERWDRMQILSRCLKLHSGIFFQKIGIHFTPKQKLFDASLQKLQMIFNKLTAQNICKSSKFWQILKRFVKKFHCVLSGQYSTLISQHGFGYSR